MSDLATSIIQKIDGKTITVKTLQSHPDGSISTDMEQDELKGTALIQLFEIALAKGAQPLIELTEEEFGEESPQSFPSSELTDSIIASVKIIKDSPNDNWENWSTGPYAESDGSSLKEEYMPYVVLEIKVKDASLLEGLDTGDRADTTLDYSAYAWL
jgi:hypothetical protein